MSRKLEVDCDRGKSKILAGRTAVNATSIRSCLWSVSLFRFGEDGGERSVADAPLAFPSARTLIGDGTLSSAYLCTQDNKLMYSIQTWTNYDSNKRSVVMQVSKSSQTRISGNNEVQLRFHIVKRNCDRETVNWIIHKVECAFCN
jgi:hypothetical protein